MKYYYKHEGMGLTEKCQIRHVFIGSCSCVDCDKCKKYNDSEFWVECDYLTKQYREKKLERVCKDYQLEQE